MHELPIPVSLVFNPSCGVITASRSFPMLKSYVVPFLICLLCVFSIIWFIGFLPEKEIGFKSLRIFQDNPTPREGKSDNVVELKFDESLKVKTLWPDDEECNDLTVRFPVMAPIVFLVSFPRSGNTWTRYMLEAASGIFSGSVYVASSLVKMGYEGEKLDWRSGKVLPIKTHSLGSDKLTQPAILLIRNPVESIMSFWSYIKGHGNMKFVVPDSAYQTPSFHKFVSEKIEMWEKLYSSRLNRRAPLLVVFYENLKANPIQEITKMLNFMGIEANNHRLHCLSKYLKGPAKRERPKYMDYLSEQEKAMIQNSMAKVATLAKNLGLDLPEVFENVIH